MKGVRIKLLNWTQKYQCALHTQSVNQWWVEIRCFWLAIVIATGAILLCSQSSYAQKNHNPSSTTSEKELRKNVVYNSSILTQMICQSNSEYFLLNAAPISEEEDLTGSYSIYSARKVNELMSSKGEVKVIEKNGLLQSRVNFTTSSSSIVLNCTLAFSGEIKLKQQSSKITGKFSNGDRLAFIDSGGAFTGTTGCSYYEWCGQPILFLARSNDASILWERAVAHNVDAGSFNIQRTTGDINWAILKDDSVVGFTDDAILIVFSSRGQLIKKNSKIKYIVQRNPESLDKKLKQYKIQEHCRENLNSFEASKMNFCRIQKLKVLKNLFSK